MKNVPTIYDLRKNGCKVRVGHHRIYYRFDPRTGKKSWESFLKEDQEKYHPDWFLQSKGGITSIQIKFPNLEEELIGYSVCSMEESYVKKIGIKKALARALSQLPEDKRKEIF
jgi:hypothetical protein